MREGISGRGRDRRLGREIFGHVCQTYVQNAGRDSQVSQTAPAPKTAKCRIPQRRQALRASRPVGSAEVAFGKIAEAVSQRQLSPLPGNLLINVHLLQRYEPLSRQRVVSEAAYIIEAQVVMAPQPLQHYAAQRSADRSDPGP